MMKLIIGDRNLSTWSWRAWLALRTFNIPFEDQVILLDLPQTTAEILKYSPSARVPCLIDGDLNIWDSLAICEYLNEKYPEKHLWPQDAKARAWARAVTCEMHSGFAELRKLCPGNIVKRAKGFDYSPVQKDIQRIQEIWNQCRQAHQHKGPYLFGDWSLADCFFAPVVFRFQTYGVVTDGLAADYVKQMLNHPALQELERLALDEVKTK